MDMRIDALKNDENFKMQMWSVAKVVGLNTGSISGKLLSV